jgi:hypothetical protein
LPNRLEMKWRWERKADKLTLSDDPIRLISAASDPVPRFALEQFRQEAGYFMDGIVVISLGSGASNRVHPAARPNANQIAKGVTMLDHTKPVT